MKFNHKMHEKRKTLSLTQTQLSAMTSIAQTILSNIENGRIVPSAFEKKEIAVALQVPMNELFKSEEN